MRPPNRVGAAWAEQRRIEIEREERGKQTNDSVDQQDGAMWLPNFGRVWQSGPRGATLKEFKSEQRKEAKSLGRPLGKRRATGSDGMVELKPYVSKLQVSNVQICDFQIQSLE